MYSGLISKIDKAKRYATERDRLEFSTFSASFRGDHDNHTVTYATGNWTCTCSFFPTARTCAHVMATERMLGNMVIPARAQVASAS